MLANGSAAERSRRGPRFEYLTNAAASAPTARFGWRLVSGNARPVGRGLATYGTVDDCRAVATTVHERRTDLRASVHLDTDNGCWLWRASLDDAVAAVCTHPFARRVECARGLEQFLATLERAVPSAGVVRELGSRALTAFGGVSGAGGADGMGGAGGPGAGRLGVGLSAAAAAAGIVAVDLR